MTAIDAGDETPEEAALAFQLDRADTFVTARALIDRFEWSDTVPSVLDVVRVAEFLGSDWGWSTPRQAAGP